MSSQAKVLFIGVDAGDKDLILRWAREGQLPTFQNLLQTSSWSVTQSPPGLYVGAIWPSFYTGVSPARHSRYCYQQLEPGGYDIKPVSSRDVKHEPFWDALGRSGKRVAVIDVPKTFASRLKSGLHIVDWGSHDPDAAGFTTWPEDIGPDIKAKYGANTMDNCNAFRTTGEAFRDFRDELVERIRMKTEISATYLNQGDWDCFLTVYSESHCVGHQCWHIHDERHIKYDQDFVEVAGDPILAVYKAIDSGIGTLLEQAGDEAQVVVFASHGMGPHYDATFMLDDILLRLEDDPPPQKRAVVIPLAKGLWKLIPNNLRQLAMPLGNKVRSSLRVGESVQRSRRKCFPIPNNDVYGGIRINLAGREPKGIIAPGRDYDAYCGSLTEDLMSFTNAVSGEPLVTAVLHSRDLYKGENLHYLPDLLVEWNRNSPVSEIFSPKVGYINGTYSKCRTGDHLAEGLVFVSGPAVKSGELQDEVSVMDLAPTIAAMTGVKLENVDGRVLTSLISPDRYRQLF